MLWTYKDNELTIYNVEMNKKRLHAIQKRIIRKYGELSDDFIWSEENIRKYMCRPKYEIKDFCIKITNAKNFEYKDNNNVTFQIISYPELAIIIEEILMNRKEAVYKLFEFKNRDVAEEEKIGIEYIDEVIENINIVSVYNSTFKSTYEMLAKLMKNGDSDIKSTMKSIQKTMIPYDMLTTGGNVKKIGSKK